MGGLAEERLYAAMRALVDRQSDVLADVTSGDSRIDELQIEIDDRCFKLIALYQPVAVDLRTIVSALKINDDLERVGDLVVNLSEAAQRYLLHPPVKPLIDLPRMGELALKMLREALDAFVSKDVRAAHSVLRQDDWLDALKNQIVRELLTFMLGDPQTIEPGVDLILMSRRLERVGDHATNTPRTSSSSSRRETFVIAGPCQSWSSAETRPTPRPRDDGRISRYDEARRDASQKQFQDRRNHRPNLTRCGGDNHMG
jgi:phosphate transport system protein